MAFVLSDCPNCKYPIGEDDMLPGQNTLYVCCNCGTELPEDEVWEDLPDNMNREGEEE